MVNLVKDTQERAWSAAEQNCNAQGGHLASVNSPSRQIQLSNLMNLDPSALGKYIEARVSTQLLQIYRVDRLKGK